MIPEGIIAQTLKKNEIDLVLSLPCIHIKQLLLLLQREFQTIDLTREEEGVGIAAGAGCGNDRQACMRAAVAED